MEDKLKVVDNRLVETESPLAVQNTTPADLLRIAIDKGADLEKLEKLMDLQERWEANEARKAYVVAMAAFKAKPPEIEKDKHVKYKVGSGGVTEYYHASLSNVAEKVNAGLSKHGLSASWTQKQENGNISVTCKITHTLGHSEETTLTAAPDSSGSKNSIQAIGSTISYLERYTLLSLTGLATKDMDDDGRDSEEAYITQEQIETLNKAIDKKKANIILFLKFMGVSALSEIPVSNFGKAMGALNKKPVPERIPGED